MIQVSPNANFHTLTVGSVFDVRQDDRFLEYRRRWTESPRRFEVGEFPIHLDIESTGVCNLRCPFCATTTENWGPTAPGYMTFDLFRRIIDEGAAEGLCSVKLSFRGEPLLHQQLAGFVDYAKKNGIIDVYFNTNATMLKDVTIHKLIDAGLDRISISAEGTTKVVYEKNRVGAKFERVVERVAALKRIRDQRGLGYPRIRIQTVLLPEFKGSMEYYVRFWGPYADEVSYLDTRREGPQDDHRGLVAEWACPFLWQRMTILWDGTLLPCLMHGVSDFRLLAYGNVQKIRIKDAWLSEQAQRYRELHMAGRAHELEACNRCSFRAMELEKLGIVKQDVLTADR